MSNRRLTPSELELANRILDEIRKKLLQASGADTDLLFAFRRKIYKELSYDERSKPTLRKKLKAQKHKEQGGTCPICGKSLPEKYAVLDRFSAVGGYTAENTRLIHADCDVHIQSSRGYA